MEDFKKIYNSCDSFYPSKPKFILTGYNYDHDECFKIFTAKKVNEGTPLFIMQHGNTYFTEDFVFNRSEYEVSKKFFTYGYNKKKFCEPFGNLRTIGRKIIYDKNGSINLFAPPIMSTYQPYYRNTNFLESLNLIKKVYLNLKNKKKEKIILRLHQVYKSFEGQRLKNEYFNDFNKKEIDYSQIDYFKFISSARLNIIFYDGTGILENLHFNVPTIVIWTEKKHFLYGHIRDDFKKKYELLKKANILFDNLNEMINHINKYWNHFDIWWFSQKTQKNISEFNKNFNNKVNLLSFIKLRKLILKNLK